MPQSRSDIILAFDYGTKKTGIAVGNRISGSARPLTIIKGDSRRQMQVIADYIKQWQPGLIVVGLPLHADGTKHAMTARAQHFADKLKEVFTLPVMMADERHSSELARQRQSGEIDDIAAAIILQDWLDNIVV